MIHTQMRSSILCSLFVLSLVASCKKDDDDPLAPSPTPSQPLPPPDAWMMGKIMRYWDVEFPLAYARFYNYDNDNTILVDVGNVSVNGTTLVNAPNYVANPADIMSGAMEWQLDGMSEFGGFTQSADAISFPEFGEITSSVIASGSDFTISLDSMSGADSVKFLIHGFSGQDITAQLPGNQTSYQFTAAEINTLGIGTASIEVTGKKYHRMTINGKIIQFEKHRLKGYSANVQ